MKPQSNHRLLPSNDCIFSVSLPTNVFCRLFAVITSLPVARFKPFMVDGREILGYRGIGLTYRTDWDVPQEMQALGENDEKYHPCSAFDKMTDLGRIIFQHFLLPYPVARSRISLVTDDVLPDEMWHTDEPPEECLRLNIPIVGDGYLQMDGRLPCLTRPGNVYFWDTSVPHRVFTTTREERISLVLGFSTWRHRDGTPTPQYGRPLDLKFLE
jgi:hypothetical protein